MLFKEALARQGISVAGSLRTVNWLQRASEPLDYSSLVELGSVESRPMSDLVLKMMKPSQNLYAQSLLLQAGARRHRAENRSQSTESLGLEEMNQFLAEAGVPKGDAFLEEGSGLSRGTRVTAHATVTLLQYMARHRYAAAFRDALPIAGVDGSLKTRLKGTAAENNARAKTGSFRFVNTLSGYVNTKGGERLVFSLMLNNYDGSGARADLDTLVEMLAEADREAAGSGRSERP
jgi:D-alanyl-D-alanine carboxypeptidase/D-alanyl-D-alanine-endopeptidase (penicillin-binding protein 4)